VLKVLLQQMMMCCDLMSTEGCVVRVLGQRTQVTVHEESTSVSTDDFGLVLLWWSIMACTLWTFLWHQSSCISMLPWQYTIMSFIIEILWNNSLWSKHKTGTYKCTYCFVFSLYWVLCSKNLFFAGPFKKCLVQQVLCKIVNFLFNLVMGN